MRSLYLILCACGSSPPLVPASEPSAPPIDAAPPITTDAALVDAGLDAASVAVRPTFEVPARGDVTGGDATGSFVTPPRADWPCAIRRRFRTDDEWSIDKRLVYGARKTCRVPVGVFDDGIIGCVERVVVRSDNKNYDLARVSYEHDGKLDLIDSNLGRTRYKWTGDVAEADDALHTKRSPGRLEYGGDHSGKTFLDVDVDGRPLRYWLVEKGQLHSRCEYAWTKTRFASKQCWDRDGQPTWSYEALYNCKALGPLTPSVNKNGPLGI